MLGQGGYQILDYREFTSDNYEKIYNLITTNKMYLIEHFKTDEVEEISLFLTAIKNENDITFLYNNKTQTLVYTKTGITNNLAQGGGGNGIKLYGIDLGSLPQKKEDRVELSPTDIEMLNKTDVYCYFYFSKAPLPVKSSIINHIINYEIMFYAYNYVCICTLSGTSLVYMSIYSNRVIDLGQLEKKGQINSDVQNVIENYFNTHFPHLCSINFTYNRIFYTLSNFFSFDDNNLMAFFNSVNPNEEQDGYELKIVALIISYDTYLIIENPFLTPFYNTLQVNNTESISVNSSITISIQSLTDRNTTITSIKPSVDGVIVSAPYYDETTSCYKATIFNATQSAVNDLILTIDYYLYENMIFSLQG